MKIQRITKPEPGKPNITIVNIAGGSNNSYQFSSEPIEKNKEPVPQDDKETQLQVSKILTSGTAVGTIWKSGSAVISGVNSASASQLSATLQNYTPLQGAAADDAAVKMLGIAQSKGANSLLLGIQAGALSVAAIEIINPEMPLKNKLWIGAGVTAAVAALIFFLTPEESGEADAKTDAQEVTIQNPEQQNSPITTSEEDAIPLVNVADRTICYWNDKKYSDGGAVCETGKRYLCRPPRWVRFGNC